MPEKQSVTRLLLDHFFRRFFDSDTLQVEGETLTTVVRAIAVVATPSLITAFFLQNQYPRRSEWGAIQDQYFFVLYSFVVMGAVAIFEWEMLFPDRTDFLILTPLPLKRWQMPAAKVMALLLFLGLFLVSSNIFGTLILPAITRHVVWVHEQATFVGAFWRQLYAHACAVAMAGLFAALFFLALGGVLLCLFGAARFRMISPFIQMLSVAALVLQLLWYMRYSDGMRSWLAEPRGITLWMPPMWFLGIYERLLHGAAAPPFAQQMTSYALYATAIVASAAILTYPLAWAHMQKASIEGSARQGRAPAAWRARLLHHAIRRPAERAAFHFIGQTITRNNRYQLYLAMYCGAGLALAVACAVSFGTGAGHIRPMLAEEGLHAVVPLLLFWVIAGLRAAFAFPIHLAARWVFRVTGASVNECARAGKYWALMCAGTVLCGMLAVLRLAHWDMRHLLVQLVCGACLCVLFADSFFRFPQGIPLNQPRMPGTKSLPLMLTLYIGILPLALLGIVRMELHYERHPSDLIFLICGVAALHAALAMLQTGPEEVEEEMEGYEGEFQVLGLSS